MTRITLGFLTMYVARRFVSARVAYGRRSGILTASIIAVSRRALWALPNEDSSVCRQFATDRHSLAFVALHFVVGKGECKQPFR